MTAPRSTRGSAWLYTFVALAVVLAALFVRLGFWQLDRLAERRTSNEVLRARLAEPVVAFEQLRDTIAHRRATLAGTPDDENEILFTGRSRNGSPGVYVLTPVRRPGNDTAVIVIRGWVYAADAATIDGTLWRESRTSFQGYVSVLPSSPAIAPSPADRKLRALTFGGVQGRLPYPAAHLYLVSQDSASERVPARLPPPTLDNGPHLSYAVQWFFFAAIALVGATIVVRQFRARTTGATGA